MAEKEEIVLYMTTISSSLEIKKKCQKIATIMASVSDKFTLREVDISRPGGLAEMRETLKDPKALPPQLYSERLGSLGGAEQFFNAVEGNQLVEFLNKEI